LSPGMAGSRSGGLIAATWAAMVSLGVEGYTRIADAIFTTADKLIEGIRAQDGIQLYGEPTFLAAFGSDEFDIFLANDYLAGQGWRLNGLQLPPGLHFCVTRPNTYPGVMESFLDDLAGAVDFARVPGRGPAASGALYGLAGTAEGNQAVDGLLSGALDAYYEAGPGGEA
ncbi:MAG: aspartate aminotransferase family protein, partial [Actinomycetota bacterium]|nr:aspartate aminotransferase family protein [Actinomycetota bacterium]